MKYNINCNDVILADHGWATLNDVAATNTGDTQLDTCIKNMVSESWKWRTNDKKITHPVNISKSTGCIKIGFLRQKYDSNTNKCRELLTNILVDFDRMVMYPNSSTRRPKTETLYNTWEIDRLQDGRWVMRLFDPRVNKDSWQELDIDPNMKTMEAGYQLYLSLKK